VFLPEVNIRALEAIPLPRAARASCGRCSNRGFTTVRDIGGADWGIREGVARGHVPGPRLFVAGGRSGRPAGTATRAAELTPARRAIAATRWSSPPASATARTKCAAPSTSSCARVWSGVASPYDPLESLQYTTDEIRAAVEEAAVFKKYVCAHDGRGVALARARPRGGRGDGVWQRSPRPAPARSVARVLDSREGALAARHHPLGNGCGRRDRRRAKGPARSGGTASRPDLAEPVQRSGARASGRPRPAKRGRRRARAIP
jgi:hypothetical protein